MAFGELAQGHQGTDLAGQGGRGQVHRELPEKQFLLFRGEQATRRAIEGNMITETGGRVDVDHTEQLTDVVTRTKSTQPDGGLHVDGHDDARVNMY